MPGWWRSSTLHKAVHRLRPSWLHNERLAELIAVIAAGVGSVVGGVHVEWYWLLALSAAIAAIVGRTTAAVLEKDQAKKVKPLIHSLVIGLALPMCVFAYHIWFDPARNVDKPSIYYFVIDGADPTQVYYPGGSPGVPGQLGTAAPVISGTTEAFKCQVTLANGQQWLEMADRYPLAWIPMAVLHPVAGLNQPPVQDC